MMRPQLIRLCLGFVALALPASARNAVAMDALPSSSADALAQAASPQAIADYRRKLKEYQDARAAFEAEAGPYWTSITEKRRGGHAKRRERKPIPVVADHLKAAAEEFQFTPQRPTTEVEFKRAYARYALAAGLTSE